MEEEYRRTKSHTHTHTHLHLQDKKIHIYSIFQSKNVRNLVYTVVKKIVVKEVDINPVFRDLNTTRQ